MRKHAADATHDENAVPGTHADASPKAQHIMRALVETTMQAFPGTHVAVILMDPADQDRFNYASNVHRKDLVALMKAVAHRLERETQ